MTPSKSKSVAVLQLDSHPKSDSTRSTSATSVVPLPLMSEAQEEQVLGPKYALPKAALQVDSSSKDTAKSTHVPSAGSVNVPEVVFAFEFLFAHLFCDFFNHRGFVYLIRDFINDDGKSVFSNFFDAGFRTDNNAAAPL